MKISDFISQLIRRMRSEDATFIQLWIVDLGLRKDHVIAYIAEEQQIEPDGLDKVYGTEPSIYLELANSDDGLFLINVTADALEERGATVDIQFVHESLTGI